MTVQEQTLRMVREAKLLAFDVETDGLDWRGGNVCGYSVSDGSDAFYVPVRHVGGGNIQSPEDYEHGLSRAFRDRSGVTVGHNLKFDIHFAANHKVILNDNVADTMVQQALIDEYTYSFSLGNVAKLYNVEPKKEELIYKYIAARFGCAPDRKSMAHFHRLPGNDPVAIEYAAGDTLTTMQLHVAQCGEIERQQLQTVANMENSLIWPLFRMERAGILCDEAALDALADSVIHDIVEKRKELPEKHIDINTRSRASLQDYFKFSGIEDWPITDKGNPSFTGDWLLDSEPGRKIMEVRKLEHFYNNFLIPLIGSHVRAGHVNCSYNQVKSDEYGTVSGRLSSSNPNMQQINKRDKVIGRMFRSIFKARPGYKLYEIDYSQAEPRLYTHYSKEPTLLKGYHSSPPIDMHTMCSQLVGVPRDPTAKIINLGILYSMGASKLAIMLKCTPEEAWEYMKKWYNSFPLVTSFRTKAKMVAEQRGYVRTILGRRRRFANINHCYKAANAIIQGGSADILKYKIVQVDQYIQSLSRNIARLLLNIHDSIVLEAENSERGEQVAREVKRIMEDVNGEPFNLIVPFVGDIKSGYTWAEATYD